MICAQCQREAICQYGLGSVLASPSDELRLFCTRKCLNAYCRDHGYMATAERRIAELEKQVDEMKKTKRRYAAEGEELEFCDCDILYDHYYVGDTLQCQEDLEFCGLANDEQIKIKKITNHPHSRPFTMFVLHYDVVKDGAVVPDRSGEVSMHGKDFAVSFRRVGSDNAAFQQAKATASGEQWGATLWHREETEH
jgi:hypothetical protein